MEKVVLNKSNGNPFYGMRNCLELFNSSGKSVNTILLDGCWEEVKDTKEKRELFYTLLFSIGDITNRQHNIFKNKKKDNGGNANRESFHTILNWIWNNNKEQFSKFLVKGLFNEYIGFDLLLRNRVKTKGNKVLAVYDTLNNSYYREMLVSYLYAVIKGTNTFNKHLVAKFLSLPRLSKRSGHKKMLPETKKIMEGKVLLLISLSKLMGWEYEVKGTYANFKGYREWRKQYNRSLESVMFSTQSVNELDKESFLKWFDTLPAQARFRVKNRILYSKIKDTEKPKYPKLQEWYKIWEQNKEVKQAEQRVLEEKVRQGQATEEDKVKLKQVKKEAKVTVGATNFNDLYNEICSGNVDKLKLETFINKVNLPYNSLVIIDDSGSMRGKPFNFATFIASVCLVKNPDDDARNLLGFFSDRSHWYSFIDRKANKTPNSILRTTVAKTKEAPLVDPTKSFYENYKNIDSFCKSVFRDGWTNISSIPEGLNQACKQFPEMLDAIKSYPIWTIVSDNDFNNLPSPRASMEDFMNKCERYFGYRPFIVAIAINNGYVWLSSKAEQFQGIDNFMYIPSNPAQIEQFLTNFKDMDTFDVYTPLLSLYRSNRYELIRQNTL